MAAKRKRTTRRKKPRGGGAIELGLLAAAAAGVALLYSSKKGATARKAIRGWMVKAKGEVLCKLERLAHVDHASYEQTVDKVLAKYRKLKDVSAEEVRALSRELRAAWRHIAREISRADTAGKRKTTHSRRGTSRRKKA
ncbi:hypothetical protein D6779_03370 [Candidatus Parcubacteria bacterium]|nr:MAG: hypothetical protein D6779_03370 [Candidatus Parcubacteria bacterium]